MNRVLLDTSAYSAVRRGDTRLQAPLQDASEVLLTPVVLGELLFGFKKGGALERANQALLDEFIDSPRVTVLPVDEGTAERYAVIRDYLRRQGTPISANDIWIAASAAQHGLRLLTLDGDFKYVPQVLLDYYEPGRAE